MLSVIGKKNMIRGCGCGCGGYGGGIRLPWTQPRRTAMSGVKTEMYETACNDPHFNLATEETMFKEYLDSRGGAAATLFLWRNEPTVVIGAHQNAYRECALKKMEEDGVILTRRRTGGGAVYHDLGNTNFTLLTRPRARDEIERNMRVVTRALAHFGVEAKVSGRNDITVGGRKVSGCAFRKAGAAALQHGTLLLNADMGALARYLTPSKLKLQSKGVKSVKSRVANLGDLCPGISHRSVCAALAEEFQREFAGRGAGGLEVRMLGAEELRRNATLLGIYRELHSWEWRYGTDPEWSTRFEGRRDWGMVDVRLDVRHGVVAAAKLYSDTLVPQVVDVVEEALNGGKVPYRAGHIAKALSGAAKRSFPDGNVEAQRQINDLGSWLSTLIVN